VDRARKCIVEKVKGSRNPFCVQELVHDASYFKIKAIPTGDDMILLDSHNPEETTEFVEGAKLSWGNKGSSRLD
jgi:hypothetical protein